MFVLSRIFRSVFLLGVIVTSLGCASSHVMLGKARPPISPEQVNIYSHPPAHYEEIAILEASSKGSWAMSQQGKMNKAIERLKEEAAELGANGVLLQATGTEYGPSVYTGTTTTTGSYAYGTGTSVPVMHKAASGVAIYVFEE